MVAATRNRGKLFEMREIIHECFPDVALVSIDDWDGAPEVDENGASFAENAISKALSAAAYTHEVSIADDSGLVVDALRGAPGVLSARYAGPGATDQDKFEKLLRELRDVAEPARTARFVCVVAVARPDGWVQTSEGTVEGVISLAPAGSGGFGYDPVFYVPAYGCTFGELGADVKNRISHRASALKGAVPLISEAFSV